MTSTASGTTSSANWTFVRGAKYDGVASQSSITSASVRGLTLDWNANLGSPAYYSPAVVGTTAIVSTTKNVAAYDTSTGTKVWSFVSSQNYTLFSAPSAIDTTVYVGTAKPGAAIYALDAKTGTLRWMHDFGTNFSIFGAPTPVGNAIVVGLGNQTEPPCSHGSIVALDHATGVTLWQHDTAPQGYGAGVWNAVGVARDGSILAPTGNPCGGVADTTEGDSVLNLDPATGHERWRFTDENALALDLGGSDNGFGATPVDTGGLIVDANKDGLVSAFDSATGAQRWMTRIAADDWNPYLGGSISSPAWDGSLLYIGGGSMNGDGSGTLNALALDGTIRWTLGSPNPVTSPPVVSNDLVFAGLGNNLVGVKAKSGVIVWSARAAGLVFGAPAVVGNGVFITSQAGELIHFELSS